MNKPGDGDDEMPSSVAMIPTPEMIRESRELLSSLFSNSPGDYTIDGLAGEYTLRLARKHPQHSVDMCEYKVFITKEGSEMHINLDIDQDPKKNLYFDTEKGVRKEGFFDSRLPTLLRDFKKTSSGK